jgi:hypothetical protein
VARRSFLPRPIAPVSAKDPLKDSLGAGPWVCPKIFQVAIYLGN